MTTFVPSHASTALGGVKAAAVPHSFVMLGAQVITGGSVSRKVMVWLHTLELPQVSVAIQVRMTLYRSGQAKPVVLVKVLIIATLTLVPSHRSKADGTPKFTGDPHSLVTLAAQLNAGPVVSRKVMVWLHTLELAQVSLALQVRVTL
jgi:hypothetical protein